MRLYQAIRYTSSWYPGPLRLWIGVGAGFSKKPLTFMREMLPELREQVEAGAAEERHSAPPVFGYVRTAIGEDAEARLAKEESFYRNHFDRLGAPEGTVGVAAADRESAQAALAEYSALDVIVVRGLASARVEPMTELARAAAPA